MKYKTSLTGKASEFVFRLFREKLSSDYLYHNFRHTVDTVDAATELCEHYELSKDDAEEILLAGWFHDTGYTKVYSGHETESIEIARQFLIEENFPQDRMQKVLELIGSTQVGQMLTGLQQEILHDADYFALGKRSFFRKGELLRAEWEKFLGKVYSDEEWAKIQLDFLLKNDFVTDYAQKKYSNRRVENIREIKKKLQGLTAPEEKEEPRRGIETMYRATYRNHIELSAIADNKANMMISINTIIMSIIISVMGSGFTFIGGQDHMRYVTPMCILLVTSLSSVIFAVLSARPNVTKKDANADKVKDKKSSLLFFGNFTLMPLPRFIEELNILKRDKEMLYDNMSIDIYYLGLVLTRKYRLLHYSYNVFMTGLIITVVTFLAIFLFFPAENNI